MKGEGLARFPGPDPAPSTLAPGRHPSGLQQFPFLLAKSPFVKLAGSCFVLLESKNILTHLVTHNFNLTASQPGWPQWRKRQGRVEEGWAPRYQDTPPLSASPIWLLWLSLRPLPSRLPLQVYFPRVPLASTYFGY